LKSKKGEMFMENSPQNQPIEYPVEADETLLNDNLYISAGYFVRTGILAGIPSPENGCYGCGS
jgi:hypothetical protein